MKVKLGDVCIIQSGGTPSRSNLDYWKNGTISWVKISDIKDKYLNFTEEYITYEGLKNSSAKIFSKGTILYTIFATLGEVSILNIEAATNQAIAGIKLVDENVYNDFLYYYLVSKKEEVNNRGRGVAQNNINLSMLKNIEIEMPNLEKQRKIANVLDKVNKIINKRQQQLKKIDELVQSRFIEMFGTLNNPKDKFKKDILKNLCVKITDGKHGGCTFVSGTGRYFIGAKEIYNGMVHYESAPEIDIREFEKDYKRCNVEKGDLLIVNTGATIGKSAIAMHEKTKYTLLQKSVALIKTKPDILNSIFLMYCYKINTSMYMVSGASAQANLLLSKINNTEIYVPNISLQNQFADFVEQIDKSKLEIQKSLDKLEVLKKSLMQQYFG